ncbi:MAG: hypothetical protein J7L47_11295 [Candidatus Odinarchaeota archaeon]|nr:hypothetical protein [Candidatus Odinarchaeota archaeon]
MSKGEEVILYVLNFTLFMLVILIVMMITYLFLSLVTNYIGTETYGIAIMLAVSVGVLAVILRHLKKIKYANYERTRTANLR